MSSRSKGRLHAQLVTKADSAEAFGNALRRRCDSKALQPHEKKLMLDASDAFWQLATRLRNLARDVLGHERHHTTPAKRTAKRTAKRAKRGTP